MKDKGNSYTNVLTLLGVAFVVLKLCKVIDWSWWLVTLPFWGGFALLIPIYFILRYKVKQVLKEEGQERLEMVEYRRNNHPKKSMFQQRLEQMQEKQRQQIKKQKQNDTN